MNSGFASAFRVAVLAVVLTESASSWAATVTGTLGSDARTDGTQRGVFDIMQLVGAGQMAVAGTSASTAGDDVVTRVDAGTYTATVGDSTLLERYSRPLVGFSDV